MTKLTPDEILEQALFCILGDTPEDMTPEDARQDTIDKIRTYLNRKADIALMWPVGLPRHP